MRRRALYEDARSRNRLAAAKTLLSVRKYEWVEEGGKDRFHSKLVADIMAKRPDVCLVWWMLNKAEDDRPNDPIGWCAAGLQGKWPTGLPEVPAASVRDFDEWWQASKYATAEAIELRRAGFNV